MKRQYQDIDIYKTWVLEGTLNFTRYFFKKRFNRKFVVGQHHVRISDVLDRILKGELTRVIFNVAPRYGKTELITKNFIAMGFALNPRAKFIHLSYSDDLARDNSRDIQSIVRTDEYQQLFPGTMPTSLGTKKWNTEAGGGMYAVSSGGQVTGFGAGLVDEEEDEKELEDALDELESTVSSERADENFGGAIVIDDPIKPDDATNEKVRDKVNHKFETTIRNRVNSRRTPIIIVMQRLDENDLCGYLEKLEPEEWTVISLPCIYTENGEEKALWPFKQTLEELHKLRDNEPWVFDTQYMQNPRPLIGLMYPLPWKTYETLPITKRAQVRNYTDTADTGADFLCSIDYVDTEIGNFVLDVLYTDKPMEYTEPETARMMTRDKVERATVESNNGGRGFRRNVEKNCRLLGNTRTAFVDLSQTHNKQARINTHSNDVQNMTYFPVGWEKKWPKFYNALNGYKKEGGNLHDDAPDCLTGTYEQRSSGGTGAARLSSLLGR
jgi:predicted phage terminase large subunit-like protein